MVFVISIKKSTLVENPPAFHISTSSGTPKEMTEKGSDSGRSGCTMIERIRLGSIVSSYRLFVIDTGPRGGSDLV